MKKNRLMVALLCGSLLVLNLAGYSADVSQAADQKKAVSLIIAGGPQGGGWFGLAGNLAKTSEQVIPGLRMSVMPGGGVGNPSLVEKGDAHLALTVSHLYNSAVRGDEPYSGMNAKNIRALAQVGTSDTCLFLVKKNLPVHSIQEIKDKKYPIKLTTTGKASTPALGMLRILKEYGITEKDIKSWGGNITYTAYTDAAQLISDGHADGIVAPVVPALVELERTVPMKLLPMDEKMVDTLVQKYGYSKNRLTKGKTAWGLDDYWQIGEPNVIIVRADVSDEIVYGITKLICEHPEMIRTWGETHARFNPETAWKDVGGILHPGAERYYKEKGYQK